MDRENPNSFAENLQKARKAARITQVELSKRTGLSPTQIRRYELGESKEPPSYMTLTIGGENKNAPKRMWLNAKAFS